MGKQLPGEAWKGRRAIPRPEAGVGPFGSPVALRATAARPCDPYRTGALKAIEKYPLREPHLSFLAVAV